MSHERALGLVLLAGAVAFAGTCWWTGLYPRTPLPPSEHPDMTAMRDSVLTEAEIHAAQLARKLSTIGGNGYRSGSHWTRR